MVALAIACITSCEGEGKIDPRQLFWFKLKNLFVNRLENSREEVESDANGRLRQRLHKRLRFGRSMPEKGICNRGIQIYPRDFLG